MSILQPEIGHTGISQFMQIARMANAFHVKVIPHASIGIGIFQAASLHAAAALPQVPISYQVLSLPGGGAPALTNAGSSS